MWQLLTIMIDIVIIKNIIIIIYIQTCNSQNFTKILQWCSKQSLNSLIIVFKSSKSVLSLCMCKSIKILSHSSLLINEQKVGMLLQKGTDTRGVRISSLMKSIYLLTTTPTSHTRLLLTTPTSHTHTFHPLSTIVIHTLNFAQVKSMDDNCG